MKPMGPKRRQWERAKKSHDQLALLIVEFNRELASCEQNNPLCAGLPFEPHAMPEPLPRMPRWEE